MEFKQLSDTSERKSIQKSKSLRESNVLRIHYGEERISFYLLFVHVIPWFVVSFHWEGNHYQLDSLESSR